jgi:hypothetical protein
VVAPSRLARLEPEVRRLARRDTRGAGSQTGLSGLKQRFVS